jgi:hypothetical protein
MLYNRFQKLQEQDVLAYTKMREAERQIEVMKGEIERQMKLNEVCTRNLNAKLNNEKQEFTIQAQWLRDNVDRLTQANLELDKVRDEKDRVIEELMERERKNRLLLESKTVEIERHIQTIQTLKS